MSDKNRPDPIEQRLADDADDKLVLAPVRSNTDVDQLAKNLAGYAKHGARIVMYPVDPIN